VHATYDVEHQNKDNTQEGQHDEGVHDATNQEEVVL